MIMFKLFSRAAVSGLLLVIALHVQADELQDANKLFKQGLHAQAMEKVNAFLVTKPKDAQARFLKGLILAEQGNTADAITVFTRLTEDYPELPEPYNNLAVLYAGQGEYEKAKNELEMAIRTNPTYATAHENLGDIYAKMASQAYDRALQLEKNNSNANTQTKLALIRELFSKNGRTTTKPTVSAAIDTAPATTSAASATPAVVATPPVTQAATAKPPVTVTALGTDPATDVLSNTKEWAAAWSAKNSKKYLAFYAKEFKTPDGSSRSAWETQRKERIAAPKSIHVEVRDAKVKVADDKHAIVSFKQTYRASHLNVISSKTLNWVKTDGQWLIAEERSGK
jgi:tetratricopeptide (TPR) repeat protein